MPTEQVIDLNREAHVRHLAAGAHPARDGPGPRDHPWGLLLGLTAVGTAVGELVAGRLTGRVGTGPLSTLALALEAVGLTATSRLGASTPTVTVVAAFALVGAGAGLFQVPNLSYVMGAISRARQGVAGGTAQSARPAS